MSDGSFDLGQVALKQPFIGILVGALLLCNISTPSHAIVRGKPVHGLALYGEPKYGPDFEHFEYVNPTAPKEGTLTRGLIGTFDSFNAFSFKGTPPPPAFLQFMANGSFFYFNEPLMSRGADEPMALYCLICKTVEVAEDNSWIEYTIRPEARFHDGTPVTADDVVFSFNILMSKGHPRYKFYWGDVDHVEKLGESRVRFNFKTTQNTELPMLVGELPVLNKIFWEAHDLATATLEIPIASGPYRIDQFEPGRFFTFKRDPNYWGKDLPVTRGSANFDEMRFDYYRDSDVSFQAFMGGAFDIRGEGNSTRWATGYDQGLIDSGALIKEAFTDDQPDTIHPFVINLRRDIFTDIQVREALALALDFDGTNRTVAHGLMEPFRSFYQGADLASSGLPEGEELEILERYRGQIPDEVFTTAFEPPRNDTDGALRDNLLKAQDLLANAGWKIQNGVLANEQSGEPFEFEFLLRLPIYERWVGPYLKNLERLGIKGVMRMVDPTQYLNRMDEFDFDMAIGARPLWGGQSNSPGNEQREMWSSDAADRSGSENWIGIKDPAIDAIIEDLIKAPTRESLVAHTHALDRILLWNHFVIPAYVEPNIWWAYWNKLGRPEYTPASGPQPAVWWFDEAKAENLANLRDVSSSAVTNGSASGLNSLLIFALVAVGAVIAIVVFRRRRT